ncbi:uncharacterized protein LAESUDRAFT_331631 [Laetiporus sulphureus 93-53]|uniref:Uncharacterized protein n=1 Tax=Laetiporus sulphureus 93-53 TaxID=1314785 RepID=A0A165CXQ7_9APHY|nr:uncharacterized protein LAESUDRAFT_331631 [Laetiporus sulphureus 93-53]KZT03688.1 hypothetical protein LAESUDRAFT_331631 [Laetiporus sulphureus 93-53]
MDSIIRCVADTAGSNFRLCCSVNKNSLRPESHQLVFGVCASAVLLHKSHQHWRHATDCTISRVSPVLTRIQAQRRPTVHRSVLSVAISKKKRAGQDGGGLMYPLRRSGCRVATACARRVHRDSRFSSSVQCTMVVDLEKSMRRTTLAMAREAPSSTVHHVTLEQRLWLVVAPAWKHNGVHAFVRVCGRSAHVQLLVKLRIQPLIASLVVRISGE